MLMLSLSYFAPMRFVECYEHYPKIISVQASGFFFGSQPGIYLLAQLVSHTDQHVDGPKFINLQSSLIIES